MGLSAIQTRDRLAPALISSDLAFLRPCWMRLAAMVLSVSLLWACASTRIDTETVNASALAAAGTYGFLGGQSLEGGDVLSDPELRAQIDALVQRQVASKGLRPVAVQQGADVLVQYWVSRQSETITSDGPVGISLSSIPVGGGEVVVPAGSGILPQLDAPRLQATLREGALVVDFLDPVHRSLLWRTSVTLQLVGDRAKTLADAESALDRAFRGFPERR